MPPLQKSAARPAKKITKRKPVPASGHKAPAETMSPREPSASAAEGNANYRVRIRMYRQGLGDCFLLTFPRKDKSPFNLLVDCGALNRSKKFMTSIVEHIEESVRVNDHEKARLDLVVATHEHR